MLLIILFIFSTQNFAQVTANVTNLGNTTPHLSSSYASFSDALAACTAMDNGIGSTAASNTVTINNNSIQNGYSTATGGGTTNNIYNNIVGDFRVPAVNAANPFISINITDGTTVNVFYNTVWLAGTSTGALFGSSAIFASTTSNLTLRNNIFTNHSTPNGSGLTVVYRI